METIRVLITDDHPLVRCGIRETLRAAGSIVLIGEASRGDEAQELCRELQPDVLLLDLQMPGATAVETMTYIRAQCAATRVIVLTAYDDEVYVRRMLAAGVMGYVLKDEVMDAVITAIQTVMQGGMWFSRCVLDTVTTQQRTKMSDEDSHPIAQRKQTTSSYAHLPLTRRQRKVLRLVEQGLSNREIAEQLCVSPRTVKKHLEDIYKRLDVHDRMTAVRILQERSFPQ